MKHLFNRVYITSVSRLDDGINKIVVGRDIPENFIDSRNDEIAQKLGIQSMPRTLYNTRRVDHFVNVKFPELLPELMALDARVVIYCDEEAYLKLYTYWLKHMFKDMSYEQYEELIRIDILDRMGSDSTFSLNHPQYQAGSVRASFRDIEVNEETVSFLKDNVDSLSLEFRMYAVKCGGDPTSTAKTIRKLLADSLDESVADIKQAFCILFYTKRMQEAANISPNKLPIGKNPINRIQGLKVINNDDAVSEMIASTDNPTALISDLRDDIRKVGAVALEIDMSKADDSYDIFYMLCEDDPKVVVDTYIEYVRDGTAPLLLIPSDVVGDVSINLITWLLTADEETPALSW